MNLTPLLAGTSNQLGSAIEQTQSHERYRDPSWQLILISDAPPTHFAQLVP